MPPVRSIVPSTSVTMASTAVTITIGPGVGGASIPAIFNPHGVRKMPATPRQLPSSMSAPKPIEMPPIRLGVNYGFNRLRFTAPVKSGARVRARFVLGAIEDVPGGVQITWNVTVDIEGSDKPALIAQWLSRRYT